jgi:hypothetical protein
LRIAPTSKLLPTAALAALFLAALLPAAAALSGPAAKAPKHDSVSGTAVHAGADPPYPLIQVRIKAFAGHTGGKPRGRLSTGSEVGLATYRGRVTCLALFGNTATVGIEIVKSSDPELVGKGQLWSVVDNEATGESDRIAGYPLMATAPSVCPPLFFNVPVVSGDYVVRDATP